MSTDSLPTLACDQTRIVLNSIAFAIGFVFSLLSCVVSYKFITINHEKEKKEFIHIGKLFCIISILALCTLSGRILCLALCESELLLYVIIVRSNRICYVSQIILMTLIYYRRIVLVFRDTVFEIKQSTIWFYRFLFTVFVTLAISLNIDQFKHRYLEIIAAAYISFYIGTMLSLCILFIHKLFKVHGNAMPDDDIVQLITKVTILAMISVIISIICVVSVGIGNINDIAEFIMFVSVIIDCFINLLFIVLSYAKFKKYYLKLCDCLHRKCIQFTKRMVSNSGENAKNVQTAIEADVEVQGIASNVETPEVCDTIICKFEY